MLVQSGCSQVTILILLVLSFYLQPSKEKLHSRFRYTPEARSNLLHCSRTHNRLHICSHKAFSPWCYGWRSVLLYTPHCCLKRILGYVAQYFCSGHVALLTLINETISTVSTLPLSLWTVPSPGRPQLGSVQLRLNASKPNRCSWELQWGHERARRAVEETGCLLIPKESRKNGSRIEI